MIKVKNLNKYYNKGQNNEIHVINDVTLELPESGLISFLGQSGSGKTTLLNVIGGLDKAVGSIEYDNLALDKYNMKKVDDFRREEIGYVFQGYNLLLEESVYNNLVIALEMVNVYDKEEQQKRIEYVLKAVGMYKYRKKKASALSGGQQQRVSIARALVKSSRIIIADEPTGNLDHENTITIMNILKKISKNTLVLVVTHNEEIANFYSDTIYTVSDGSITSSYESSGTSLSNKSSNNIYLKDMKHDSIENDGTKIDLYGDEVKLSLRVVYKNGTYYIDSPQSIKLIEGSNIKLLDKHYEEITMDTVDDFTYDNSWFKKDSKKKNYFKSFIENIKISYNNMKAKRKRTKVLYASFFIIGILFASCAISISNAYVVDTSNYGIDPNYDVLTNNSYYNSGSNESLIAGVKNGYIDDIQARIYINGKIDLYKTSVEQKTIYFDYPGISARKMIPNILYGKKDINQDEIILSKGVALKIVEGSKGHFNNIKDLIGIDIKMDTNGMYPSSGNYKIAGINDNEYIMCYLNDKKYISLLEDSLINHDTMIRTYKEENYNGHKSYKVVEGSDISLEEADRHNCLIPIQYKERYELGSSYSHLDKKYKVVGYYEHLDFKSDELIPIIPSKSRFETKLNYISKEYKDIKLLEGRMPEKPNEVIASVYTKQKVGYETSNGYTIVGIFNGGSDTYETLLYTRDVAIAGGTMNIYTGTFFNSINRDEYQKYLKDDILIKNSLKCYKDIALEDQKEILGIYGTFGATLLIIVTIFIYFIMRSRMISEIYSLGVYRSLGAPKRRIYTRYLFDILVLVTLTSVVGYAISMIFYTSVASGLNSILGAMVAKNSLLFTFGGIFIMYLLNIVFGLLPVYLLMRKTPAEILSKYDI